MSLECFFLALGEVSPEGRKFQLCLAASQILWWYDGDTIPLMSPEYHQHILVGGLEHFSIYWE